MVHLIAVERAHALVKEMNPMSAQEMGTKMSDVMVLEMVLLTVSMKVGGIVALALVSKMVLEMDVLMISMLGMKMDVMMDIVMVSELEF